jgi:hypothetical protein
LDGPVTLRQALVADPSQFASTVTERLLTYALGRGVEYYDRPVVRRIVRDSAAGHYRWSALILGIVESLPFRSATADGPAPERTASGRSSAVASRGGSRP